MSLRPFEGIEPRLGDRVYVDPAATIIGDVVLGDDCSVWPGTVIRGDIHHIRIGARTNVQDNSTLHVTHASEYTAPEGYPLHIGEEVTIGHGAIIHACTIGHRCLIGMGSIVLDGAVLDFGTARLPKRKARVGIWVARSMTVPAIYEELRRLVERTRLKDRFLA